MEAIVCKSGKIFAACVEKYIDAEWRLQVAYYKAQGCSTRIQESVSFEPCNCEHCDTLEHNFEELIEEVKESNP